MKTKMHHPDITCMCVLQVCPGVGEGLSSDHGATGERARPPQADTTLPLSSAELGNGVGREEGTHTAQGDQGLERCDLLGQSRLFCMSPGDISSTKVDQ